MKKKTFLSTFLVLASFMLVILFSSCTKNSEKKATVAQSGEMQPVTISMLYCDNANYPYTADWKVLQDIKTKTGITLDLRPVPSSDYATKEQLMLADPESMPDIISHVYATASDAMSGVLLPISDYEDQMPNFKAFIEKNGLRQDLDNTRFSDGKYYTMPTKAKTTKQKDQMWLIRTDVFEKNNIPVPTTIDELFQAGVTLKKLYPDSTPITNRFGTGNLLTGMAGAYGTIAGWTLGDGMFYNNKTDSWEYAPTTDKYKSMIQFVKKLLDAGVLDTEWATLDSTTYEQRIVEGKTFMMYDWIANNVRYNTQGTASDPDFNVGVIYPPKGEDGNYAVGWAAPWTQGTVFPADLKNRDTLDAVLRFIDWSYTDEAETIMTFGTEGETYKVVDGVKHFIDPDNVDYSALYGLDNNSLAFRESTDYLLSSLDNVGVKLMKQIAADGIIDAPNPASPLSPDEIEASKIYSATLIDYVNSQFMSFISGQTSLDAWDAYVAECESKGSVKLAKTYNDAWSNRK